MNETIVTVVGNLVDDPRLHQFDGGNEVANFRVAATSRRKDKLGEWVDGGTLFLTVSCWRAMAGNVAGSLHRGDPVVVTGKLTTRTYEKDGQSRSVIEMEAYAVGPDLARGTASFRRTGRPADEAAYDGGGFAGGELRAPADDLVGAGV